jgi:hypothetical protein
MLEKVEVKNLSVFNSPLEIALRVLFIFDKTSKLLDLQRLIYYNYLLVHSADMPDSPKSLHADLPRRSCEMLVSRTAVKKGLTLLLSRDLIDVKYSKAGGILYRKNDNTGSFTQYFESTYSKQLQERAEWISSTFDKLTDSQLAQIMDSNIGKWGSEFSVIYDEEDYNV